MLQELKGAKCPSTDEKRNKIWYTRIMKCYSAIRGSQSHDTTWVNLGNIQAKVKEVSHNRLCLV